MDCERTEDRHVFFLRAACGVFQRHQDLTLVEELRNVLASSLGSCF